MNGTDPSAAAVDLPTAKEKASRGESYMPKIYDEENLANARVLVEKLHTGLLDGYVHAFKTLVGYFVKYWTRIVSSKPRDLEFREGQDIGPFEKALRQDGKVFAPRRPSASSAGAPDATRKAATASGIQRRSVTGFFPPQKVD